MVQISWYKCICRMKRESLVQDLMGVRGKWLSLSISPEEICPEHPEFPLPI